MVDLEILQKRENALLKRTEVHFRLTHPKEKTPQRGAVRDKVASSVGGKKDGVIIAYLRSRFGSPTTVGYAKVYPSADAAKKMEPQFLLRRHGLVEEKKKEAPAAEAKPPPPPKKEEKPADKKAAPAPEKKAEEKKPAPAAEKKGDEKKPTAAPEKKAEEKKAAPAAEKK